MVMTRRMFTKGAGTGLLVLATGAPTILLEGCPTSSTIFSDIIAWIPIGTSAINGVVSVLGSFMPPGLQPIITLVLAGLADLAATVTQYKNDTNPADKATLLAKIRTILNDVATNFQSFLDKLNIGNNPIEAIVLGLANVVLSALAGFLGQLPASGKVMSSTYRLSGKTITYTPKFYKNTKQFVADFNAVAIQVGHPEIIIH